MPRDSLNWCGEPCGEVGELGGSAGTGAEAGGAGSAPERMAVGFARSLRAMGLAVPPSRVITYTRALGLVGLANRDRVFWAGRATLIARPEDAALYDRVFAAYWLGTPMVAGANRAQPVTLVLDDGDDADTAGSDPPSEDEEPDAAPLVVRYSAIETLRRRDFAAYGEQDWAEAHRLIAALRPGAESRPARRARPVRHRHGVPDIRRTVRRSLRTGGEPFVRARQAPSRRPRRVVLVLDVSGSMEAYARALLRFAHAVTGANRARRVEVFTLGTRLTRLTRELQTRDPDSALAEATSVVPDWSGGTRLGEGIGEFNDRWGISGLARGAVVVILSDGWDRGDPALMAAEMARLARVAHRVIWANPLKASAGFAPLARGMAAALPWVDDLVAGHSVDALEHLAAVIGGGAAGQPDDDLW